MYQSNESDGELYVKTRKRKEGKVYKTDTSVMKYRIVRILFSLQSDVKKCFIFLMVSLQYYLLQYYLLMVSLILYYIRKYPRQVSLVALIAVFKHEQTQQAHACCFEHSKLMLAVETASYSLLFEAINRKHSLLEQQALACSNSKH